MCRKARYLLGFLHRNFWQADSGCLAYLYKSFVRPVLEYCCSVWDPYYIKDIDQLEKVQHFAAKLTTGKWECSRLHNTVWGVGLGYSLKKEELSEAVSVPKNFDWLFSYTTHGIFPCKQFKPPTGQLLSTIYSIVSNKASFFVSVVRLWNSVPDTIISLSSNSV